MNNNRKQYKVLFTGSREWTDKDLIRNTVLCTLEMIDITAACHGSAHGLDTLAGEICKEINIPVHEFPANWEKYGKAAGPIRNIQMIEEFKPTLVLAFHPNILSSKGTQHCIKEARKRNIPVILIGG